jgi:tRNA U38,U39,U40 pseudouridine synthase TruA
METAYVNQIFARAHTELLQFILALGASFAWKMVRRIVNLARKGFT